MKRSITMAFILLAAIISGCQNSNTSYESRPAEMIAQYTSDVITIDGKLDESIWKQSKIYTLTLANDMSADGKLTRESTSVRLAWDDQYFYVGISCVDSDLVAEGHEDELPHFKYGDVCELFLKPDNQTWYWELYVTPRGNKTNYFIPGCGRLGLPSSIDYTSGLKVAAKANGTLDNWRDKDFGWEAEMAMPISDLNAYGDSFSPGNKWRILVARYNYSRYFNAPRGPELTMTPKLSKTNFHLLTEYGYLVLANSSDER